MQLHQYKWDQRVEPFAKNIQPLARKLCRITPACAMEDLLQIGQLAALKDLKWPIRSANCAMLSHIRDNTKMERRAVDLEPLDEELHYDKNDPLATVQIYVLWKEINDKDTRHGELFDLDWPEGFKSSAQRDFDLAKKFNVNDKTIRNWRRKNRQYIIENWKD